MKRLAVLSISLGAALAAAAAATQEWAAAPNTNPEARLADRGASFLATVERKPDHILYARGRLVAMGGSARGGAGMACFTCHGPTGAGDAAGAFPRLAQLPGWYMYKQLGDYASGSRPNDVMTPIAQALSAAEREAVSVYYALSTAPRRDMASDPAPEPRRLQWGAALVAIGSAERGIPACVNCHGGLSEGIPPSVPGIAGQNQTYTAAQLALWKEGVRRNDPLNVMGTIAAKMTDDDIQAVADYLARLAPPGWTGDKPR
jgi:cytochrome c553